MENSNHQLRCEDLKKFDLAEYLKQLGHYPAKRINNDLWFFSPFHDERTPSFKINTKLNTWYDFSEGKGGTLIDFATQYHGWTIPELLRNWQQDFSRQHHYPKERATEPEPRKIFVQGVRPINHPALINYASSRAISQDLLLHYCKEVHFELYGKKGFAIGFKNDLGGFELRNKFFKGSSSPKGITCIRQDTPTDTVKIFEGFFDFLSHIILTRLAALPTTDFLILNSITFFESARMIMESYKHSELYLDNNLAGRKTVEYAKSLHSCYEDHSYFYKKHEDLNDYLLDSQRLRLRKGRSL